MGIVDEVQHLDPNARGGCATSRCPICDSAPVAVFFEMRGIPTSDGRLWPTREQARAAVRGDLRLAFCRNCGTIANQAFDPSKLSFGQGYNASLEHSPIYRQFIQDVAHDLVERYTLKRKAIVEIACGSGEFLRLLCRYGQNEGFGFDPSLPTPGVEHLGGSTITFIQDFYSDRYVHCHADLVCCRHLVSSVEVPKDLIGLARRALSDRAGGLIYIEVPDARSLLRDAVWNLTYEHCFYFADVSLTRLLATSGFDVRDVGLCFSGQYVAAVATPAVEGASTPPISQAAVDALAEDVAAFAQRHQATAANWRCRLEEIEHTGRRTVAWGAGGRAITLLNALRAEQQIPYVVDVNPSKQGTYLAGTGQPIVPPSFLIDYRPDVVIITNSTFEQEIRQQAMQMGLACEFLVA